MTQPRAASRVTSGPLRAVVPVLLVGAVLLVSALPPGAAAAAGSAAGPERAAAAAPGSPSAEPGDWWYDKLRVADAHRVTRGAGITIGLIDGPVDPTVPELAGQPVVPVTGFCTGQETAVSRAPHATHATGLAALLVGSGRGTGPGGTGQRGIAPEAQVRVYAVDDGTKAPSLHCLPRAGERGVLTYDQVVGVAIDAAVRDGVDVLNISLGGGDSRRTAEALGRAREAGVLVVVAAGNRVGPVPAQSTNVLALDGQAVAVTAVDSQAQPWPENASGTGVLVGAPGVDLALGGRAPDGAWDSTLRADGTSAAAALVSGTMALVRSRYPDATRNQLVRHLATSTSASELFHTDELGFGIISLARLLEQDPGRQPDDDPFATRPPGSVDVAVLLEGRPVAAPGTGAPAAPAAEDGTTATSGRDQGLPTVLLAALGIAAGLVLVLFAAVRTVRRRSHRLPTGA